MTGGTVVPSDVAALIADADAAMLGRVLLAVTAMHEPDVHGRCPHCRSDTGGWRRAAAPCPTRRVIDSTLRAAAQAPPRWTPA